jgi:hypothetical protein
MILKGGSMTDTMTTKSRNTKAKTSKLFPDELIDQLLAQVQTKDARSILGESGLAGQLKKQLAERMLAAELNHHLTTEVAQQPAAGNHRNGTSPKTVTPAANCGWIIRVTGWPHSSRNWWPIPAPFARLR